MTTNTKAALARGEEIKRGKPINKNAWGLEKPNLQERAARCRDRKASEELGGTVCWFKDRKGERKKQQKRKGKRQMM